jgi:hypothetical protein
MARRDDGETWVTVQLGALDQRPFPDEGTVAELVNVQYDPESAMWRTCWGFANYTPDYDGGDIVALHWWQPGQNIRHMLIEHRTSEETADIATVNHRLGGTVTQLCEVRHIENMPIGTLFIDVGRYVLFVSPHDGVRKYDGRFVSPLGWAGPPSLEVAGPDQNFNRADSAGAAFATPFDRRHETRQRGVGEYPSSADAAWRYGYRLTVIDEAGNESPASAMVFASGTNTFDTTGKRMVMVKVGRQADHARAVRVWRTFNLVGITDPAATARCFLLETIPSAHAFYFVDHKPDLELVTELDESQLGAVPNSPRAAALWQNSLFLGGMPDDPAAIRESWPRLLGQFPAEQRYPVGSAGSGPVVSLTVVSRGVLVGKTGGLYLLKGEPGARRVEVLTEESGPVGPKSVCVVPDMGVFFVDRHGPKLLVGSLEDEQSTQVVPLDKRARRLWREVSDTRWAQCVYDPVRRAVFVSFASAGSNQRDLLLVWHLEPNSWSLQRDVYAGAMQFYAGRLFVGSSNAGQAPGVFVATPGSFHNMEGDEIVGELVTNTIEGRQAWRAARLEAIALAQGEVPWTLESRTDRALAWTSQSESELHTHQLHFTPDIWGAGDWATVDALTVWGDYEPTRVSVSMHLDVGFGHQFRLTSASLSFSRLELMLEPGTHSPRPIERRPE